MNGSAPIASRRTTPQVSPFWIQWFSIYTRRFIRRRFHRIRILADSLPNLGVDSASVVFLNHASWWDPLVCLILSRQYYPDRKSFAPIDAAMLSRYRFFRRLGFYGIDRDSSSRGIEFIRETQRLLKSNRNLVWLTPQGEFADVRTRPLNFQKGIGSLVTHSPAITCVPMAIEYTFWTEPRPEILVAFGPPLNTGQTRSQGADAVSAILQGRLERTQDRLAEAACRRNASEWKTLDHGSTGVSIVYDAWRWFRARLQGVQFSPEHQPEHSK